MTPVVDLTVEGAVAVVRLRDRARANRISPELSAAFTTAAAAAAADPRIRTMLVTGSVEVFCAGAERADLADGWSTRLDAFVRAPARFPLPVVAAVRGSALGGGLLFALYADVTVVGRTATLAANFLDYGFTPCGGSTHLLPMRLGGALGTEMLLTGRPYVARELADRGAGLLTVEASAVEERARAVAARIARAPRDVLARIKTQLGGRLVADSDAAIARELADHRATIRGREAQQRLRDAYPRTVPDGRTA
jgi:polyketide biosynthesis enoyl-CoA hydratase PksI